MSVSSTEEQKYVLVNSPITSDIKILKTIVHTYSIKES
jgi:hypothetical protein